MALHKAKLTSKGFPLPQCEKHFHDHDETWLIHSGQGTGYWIDHEGRRENFILETGDVWMIPAGYEHGSDGPNSTNFIISVFNGTQPPGSHKPGHYYVEKEGYVPSLQLVRTPTERYREAPDLPATMKGVMFVERGKAVLQDEATPSCPPGHILCRMLYSGVTNGTERNVLMGGNYGGTWPSRCAYQSVGEIIRLGAGTKGFAVGDRIFSGHFHGHVHYFSVDVSEPEATGNWVIKLPSTVNPPEAALFGMASVSLHDVRRRAEVRLGDRVLVVGAGCIGLFTAQVAKAAGARVTVCDLDEARLELARKMGITAVRIEGDKTWEEFTAGDRFDVVFEDSGAPLMDKIIGVSGGHGIIKHRGKVVMVAGRKDVTYNFNLGQRYEVAVLHVGHFKRPDLEEVYRLVSEGLVQVKPLLQEIVPIDKAVGIYDRLRDNPGSLLGTVFDWKSVN